MGEARELFRLEKISKSFSAGPVLSEVSLSLHAGEILGLMGENGAGKSTLMKVLAGVYPHGSFTGKIFAQGKAIEFHSPAQAMRAGIATIHQELAQFPQLTVAENMFVGQWPRTKIHTVDWKILREQAKIWLAEVGATFSAETPLAELSLGNQQLVEIAKALARKSQLLILDEPTSSLPPSETARLFALLRKVRDSGKALVYISHRMEEIFELCNRISVLRDGQHIFTRTTKTLSTEELVQAMVGRPLQRLFPTAPVRAPGPLVLELRDYAARVNKVELGPVNLKVHAGEIVGIGGLLGAGRSELARSFIGDHTQGTRGEIRLHGKRIQPKHPRAALRAGIALLSEDRKHENVLPLRSVQENFYLSSYALSAQPRLLWPKQEVQVAKNNLAKLRTKYTTLRQDIQTLSGGNQQKVFLAKILATNPSLLILDEPTRGVDVGAKFEIYELIFQLAQNGKAILLISSDLQELMALSDRIVMMRAGRISESVVRENYSANQLLRLALGTGAKT